MTKPNLVLDAMGVIYRSCDDVAELLVPFIQERTRISSIDIKKNYHSASLGHISSSVFWENVGLDDSVEDEYLLEHSLTPGLLPFLRDVREDVDSIWCLLNDVSEWLRKLRERFGIAGLFDGFVISGDVGLRKPDTNIYKEFLKTSRLGAAEIIFVDDRPKNLTAATELGLSPVLFGADPDANSVTMERVVSFSELLTTLRF